MNEPRDHDEGTSGVAPSELTGALPVEPIDASLRMRAQRAARAVYEKREERSLWLWQDTLVPGTLLLTGALYFAGALQKLLEIFG
jgi:hypothetical protein